MRDRYPFVGVSLILFCFLSIAGGLQTETQAVQLRPPAAALEYIGAWGTKGDGPGELQDPVSIAADNLGNAYIADPGTGFIHKFASYGKALLSFQEDGLKHPQSIAVDGGGAIYVTDPARASVFIFLPGGDHYRELRLRSRPSTGNFLSVAVADDGLIYIFDSDAAKVLAYNSRFRLEQTWEMPTSGSRSGRIPGPIETGHDGFLYIANSSGNISKFTREGHFVSEITPSANQGKWNPTDGFAVSNNFIFVMDSDGRMLHILDSEGKPRLDVDLAPELGQGSRPAPPLAVSTHHELLVLDAPERRVLRYRINF
ncbi:MAG: NHL repeat-containing protein [Candidatus Acidiferrales bacterium]|jgi:DNA-binding beta-propeller fold protein YncE